jgi:O-antigen/teichoic acid export membrane protein
MAALANLLQGQGRFGSIAFTAALGSIGYLAAIVFLVGSGATLAQLGWAVIVQQIVLLLSRAVLAAGSLTQRPGFVTGEDAVAIAGLSARLQLSVASLIINGQSDRVVAGLVASPAVVAEVGIASQLSESGRLVAAAPLVPIFNRFASLQGPADEASLLRLFSKVDRLWITAAIGATLIGIAAAPSLISGWLGSGFALAGALAAMLVAAFGSNLLFGVRISYLRACGSASLEARLATLLIALNLAFTVPLAIAFGASGVVAGTLIAYLIAGAWFAERFRRYAPEAARVPGAALAAAVLWGIVFALIGGGLAALAASAISPGWALVPVGFVALASWAGYLACALRIRPTPSGLRHWREELEAQLALSTESTTQSP